MKVVALLGSPRRKGNSSGIAELLTSAMAENGHDISIYYLNHLNYKGCQACEGCKSYSETCVLNDGLTPVLHDVAGADVLVLASPVYWGEISSQMKGFIDRMYSYLTPEFISGPVKHRLGSGKKFVCILSQGADQALYSDIFPRYNDFFEQIGLFAKSYLIRGCELSEKEDYRTRQDLKNLVTTTVRDLNQH